MEHASVMRTASLLHESARQLSKSLDRRLATRGVTAQQAALLVALANGETSPKQLAATLGTDTAGATRLIDRLESKALLRRHRAAEDRRAVVLELTAAGRQLVPALVPAFAAVSAEFFDGLTEADIRGVGDALAHALANVAAAHDPSAG
ncbi:MarR family transcriptional regulator [Nocardia sp. NPDC052254]|uniref:MarR family winged helix-turn-helix transcriptional regulator n=1 Tax=Nocardia sp. NPDC052254 TaxID=3155681 RepID=UPI00343F6C89